MFCCHSALALWGECVWRRVGREVWGWGDLETQGLSEEHFPWKILPTSVKLICSGHLEVWLFPKLTVLKVLPSGQLPAGRKHDRTAGKEFGRIRRRNAPERSWAAFLYKLPESGKGPLPMALFPLFLVSCCAPGRPGAVSAHCTAGGEATAAHGTVCCSQPPSTGPRLLWGAVCGWWLFFSPSKPFSLTVSTSQRDTVWENTQKDWEFQTKQT